MLNRKKGKAMLPRYNNPSGGNDDSDSNNIKRNSFRNSNSIKSLRKGKMFKKLHQKINTLSWKIIFGSLFVWALIINHYERTVVHRAIKKCQWSTWEDWPKDVGSYKVGLFADPQIMDDHSYPGRPWIVNYITRVLLDHYHRRNWKYVQYYLDPDANFFLGDLFDGGRNWDDDMWMDEYRRFHSIFPKKPGRKTIFSLPGNHDIGFGETVIESSFDRFTTFFGPTSSSYTIGNHTFVLLDTIALSDTTNENVSSIPREFLNQYSQLEHPYPSILLTHVPLWRNAEQQTCGDFRESSKPFPIMRGEQYQTVIDQSMSQEILSKIEPKYIFSGDDHDYCHIKHNYFNDGKTAFADEITVKSCAMNMGIKRPAIQLVSLYNDGSSNETIQTEMCYMPDPFKPIWIYIILAIVNLVIVCIITITKQNQIESVKLPMPIGTEDKGVYTHKIKKNIFSGRGNSLLKDLVSIFEYVSVIFFFIIIIFYYYYALI